MQNQLRRVRQFIVKNKPKLILGGLLGIALLTALLVLSPANALSGQGIAKTIFLGIFEIFGTLANLLSRLFLSIINSVILPGQNSLIFGTQLESVWKVMLTIANSIFFIALFVFAILIITRQAGYNFKKAITTLIVAVVMANLSLEIIRLLIEAGDALRNTASQLPGVGSSSEELVTWFNGLLSDTEIKEIALNDDSSLGRTILLSFGLMAAEIAIMVALFKLMGVLIERAIRLAILAIFAPVQVAISILPQKELQNMGTNWLSDAIKWVLVLPIAFILIGVARIIMPSDTAEAVKAFLQGAAETGGVDATNTGTLFLIIIGIGIIVAAGNSAAILKLPVEAAAKFFSGAADKATSAVGKFAYRNTLGTAGKAAGTYAKTQWEAAKQTKFGKIVGTPARKARVRQAAAEAKLESMQKLGQKGEQKQINARLRTDASRQLRAYKEKETAYVKAHAQTGDDVETAILKDEFRRQDPTLSSRQQAAKRTYNVTTHKMGEERREINAPVETTIKEIKDLAAKRAKLLETHSLNSDEVRNVDDELTGLLDYASGKVSNSPEGQKWGEAMAGLARDQEDAWAMFKADADESGQGLQFPYLPSDQVLGKYSASSENDKQVGSGAQPTHLTAQQVDDFAAAQAQHSQAEQNADATDLSAVTVLGTIDRVDRLKVDIDRLDRTEILNNPEILQALASLSDADARGADSLSGSTKDEISDIMGNARLTDVQKAAATETALKQNPYFESNPTGAQRVAALLSHGGAQNWNALRNLAASIRDGSVRSQGTSAPKTTSELADLVQRLASARTAEQTARANLGALDPTHIVQAGDAYTVAVQQSTNPDIRAEIARLYEESVRALQSSMVKGSNDASSLDVVNRDLLRDFSKLVQSDLKLGSAISPEISDWEDGIEVGSKLTVAKVVEELARLHQAGSATPTPPASSGPTPPPAGGATPTPRGTRRPKP
ncbi:MAG: hypothetical protein WC553_02750 [Patescibacteria group bacterium]|jgi:hypothetical protein